MASTLCISLLFLMLADFTNGVDAKIRQKREWVVPAQKLKENVDYTGRQYVARIRSDKDESTELEYYLSGPGATEEPMNLFIVDRKNGLIRITGMLDREKISNYTMSAIVKYKNGSIAEDNIGMTIVVEDENDNAPEFLQLPPGNVPEGSLPGTFVTQVTATDKDDPTTLHVKIGYSIIKQEPEDTGYKFNIDSSSGKISVWKPDIDRETCRFYVLTVKATDMNGHPGGLTGTGTVTVKVLDINDNMPKLEKDEYEANVDENTANVEVLRMKVLDADLEHTDNWIGDFEIVSGNEDGAFSIETDPKTNEGVLILRKEIDFEQVSNMQLGVVVQNRAPFQNSAGSAGSGSAGSGSAGSGSAGSGSMGSGSSSAFGAANSASGGTSGLKSLKQYAIKVNVRNLPDAPRFVPKVKTASVPEDGTKITLPHVIATYPATDGDLGTVAKNVWYAKEYDPDQWLSIDEKTAEVKLNKVPDRESKNVKDGIYYAKVIGVMTDFPYSTATGTIAIQVQDSNDHCPQLRSTHQLLCSDVQAVTVTAVDEDSDPNAAPFEFTLLTQNPSDRWKLETFNGTTAVLRPNGKLWSGSSKITMVITDHQGLACSDNQVLNLDVCTCTESPVCETRTVGWNSKSLGPSAIGALLFGILLLLLAPFLLLYCGTVKQLSPLYADLSHDNVSRAIVYNTEGIGEDKEVPILPVMTCEQMVQENCSSFFSSDKRKISEDVLHNALINTCVDDYMTKTQMVNQGSANMHIDYGGSKHISNYITLPMGFLENYYSQKARYISEDNSENDTINIYKSEFGNSLAGSVASLSFVDTNDNLDFLTDLDPKFKMLAEVCTKGETGFEGYKSLEKAITEHEPNLEICSEGSKTGNAQQLNTMSSNTTISAGKISMTAGTQQLNTASSNAISSAGKISMTAGRQQVSTASSNTTSSAGEIPKTTATFPNLQVREDTIDSSLMCLIEQPVYYTTTPVLQPTRYVVEPQVQNTVLVSGWPSVPNTQTMYVVNGAPRSETMILKGERVLVGPSAQTAALPEHLGTLRMKDNLLLVERKGTAGLVVQEATAGSNQGLVQRGNDSKFQNVILSRQVQLEGPSLIQGTSGSTHVSQMQDGFTGEYVKPKGHLRTWLPEGSTAGTVTGRELYKEGGQRGFLNDNLDEG